MTSPSPKPLPLEYIDPELATLIHRIVISPRLQRDLKRFPKPKLPGRNTPC
ncbi:hypothetical protein LCGC14_2955900, partial [marine sediment metagenome]